MAHIGHTVPETCGPHVSGLIRRLFRAISPCGRPRRAAPTWRCEYAANDADKLLQVPGKDETVAVLPWDVDVNIRKSPA